LDSCKVYLVQTDTTVGFLCADPYKLSRIKQRDPKQKILRAVDNFSTLQKFVRVPNKFKKRVRNAKKTTFIYPSGDSFRVVEKGDRHQNFLKKFHILFSTSANRSKNNFNERFAFENSDVIVYNHKKFYERAGSQIVKLNQIKIKNIR
jgi:tRNA A37 threonylcarbamoyladenosine synthetase subunit TsaC/SUA5/YrdC